MTEQKEKDDKLEELYTEKEVLMTEQKEKDDRLLKRQTVEIYLKLKIKLYESKLNSISYNLCNLILHETRTIKEIVFLPYRIFNLISKKHNKKTNQKDINKKFNNKKFEKELLDIFNNNNNNLVTYIDNQLLLYPKYSNLISKKVFIILKDLDTKIAVQYGVNYIDNNLDDISFLKVLVHRLKKINKYEKMYEYYKLLFSNTGDRTYFQEIIEYEYKCKIKDWQKYSNNKQIDMIEKDLDELLEIHKEYQDQIYRLFANSLTDFNSVLAFKYIKKAIEIYPTSISYSKLFDLHIRLGNIENALKSIPKNMENPTIVLKKSHWKENYSLINKSFPFPNKAKSKNDNSNKIFYLLHNSLPYHSGGYATRAHGLMSGVNNQEKYEMIGVSRLGYPKDILKLNSCKDILDEDYVNKIKYLRLKSDTRPGNTDYLEYIAKYAESICKKAVIERPLVIHGASNFMNGLAAVYSAKLLGVKSIYEIRGLWEITRISREPEFESTDLFTLNKTMETEAAKNADVVITITQALKEEMITRGVDESKIKVISNGVDTERFIPLIKDDLLSKSLLIDEKIVIGYIGSIVQYEGLDLLVKAVEILVNKGIVNIIILIVGDGASLEDIQYLVSSLNLDKYFIFTGRIPHEEVEKYYSIVDIAPFPRKGQPVTEMVSPLKPFEAMAMEKAVISSDVAALSEIIDDKRTGLLFKKDNIEDFAEKLELLINDGSLRNELGQQARNWVVKEKDWKILAKKLNNIYEDLLKKEGN